MWYKKRQGNAIISKADPGPAHREPCQVNKYLIHAKVVNSMILYNSMITSSIHFSLIENMTSFLEEGRGVIYCNLFYKKMVDNKWEIIFIIGAGI